MVCLVCLPLSSAVGWRMTGTCDHTEMVYVTYPYKPQTKTAKSQQSQPAPRRREFRIAHETILAHPAVQTCRDRPDEVCLPATLCIMFSSTASQSHIPLGVYFTNMKFHTSTSPPCLSYAPLIFPPVALLHHSIQLSSSPPQTTKIFAFQALLKRPSSTIFHRNCRVLPFCHSKSCTLTSPRQTWAWVTHIHILCLWRWFALGEVNTSSKSLWKPL